MRKYWLISVVVMACMPIWRTAVAQDKLLPPGQPGGVIKPAPQAQVSKPDSGAGAVHVVDTPPLPPSRAPDSPPPPSTSSMAEKFFSRESIGLGRNEKRALEIDRNWKSGIREDGRSSHVMPVPGPGGVVMMLFGEQQPSVVCAVLQVCDISLQVGEKVNSVHLGDATRWVVDPAITGEGADVVQHLIVKPLDVALETSMVVATNRRTYHIQLRSDRDEYMSNVAFNYPEDMQRKWMLAKALADKEKGDNTIPETNEYLGNLDFGYDIIGDAPWKPVRVYNDGVKTIIDMPKAMNQTESPMLLVIRRDSTMFTKEDRVMVNYRIQDNRYVVDSVFNKAILVTGVGKHKTRVTIARRIGKI